MRRLAVALFLAGAVSSQVAPPAVLQEVLADSGRPVAERIRALGALQDAAALAVPSLLLALDDEDGRLGAAAAALLRHEWVVLPPELFAGLEPGGRGAERLLRELAMAGRPAALPWLRKSLQQEVWTPAQRCLLLAARGEPLQLADAELLLAALLGDGVDEALLAASSLLPAKVADAMVGPLQARLEDGSIPVARVLPLVERMTRLGHAALLAAALSLPPDDADELCLFLRQRESEALRDWTAAALDGRQPMAACLLLDVAGMLGPASRRERLLAMLGDPAAVDLLAERAFDALVAVRCIEPPVLRFALAAEAGLRPARIARLLAGASDDLPDSLVESWLFGEPELAQRTAAALAARPLRPAREAALQQLLLTAGVATGPVLGTAMAGLLRHGSPAALQAVWPLWLEAAACEQFLDLVRRRPEAEVTTLLQQSLLEPPAGGGGFSSREACQDALRLALVARGERRWLAELVARADEFPPTFLRRCRDAAAGLPEGMALQLLRIAATADEDRAGELVAWAATTRGPALAAALRQIWDAEGSATATEFDERQEVALWAWAAGPGREELADHLQRALAQPPLSPRDEWLAFAALGNLPDPWEVPAMELAAALALVAGLNDTAAEAARAGRWPEGRGGFSLVAAVAERLRDAPPALVERVFGELAQRLQAPRYSQQLSRQRVLVLWHRLAGAPEVLQAVGRATAPLLLAIAEPTGRGDGAASYFAAQAARQRGDLATASQLARRAVAGLLRSGEDRLAMLSLGDRRPSRGEDAWAGLAALPWLCAAEQALAAGDATTFVRARAAAYELVGADQAMRRALDQLPTRLPQ